MLHVTPLSEDISLWPSLELQRLWLLGINCELGSGIGVMLPGRLNIVLSYDVMSSTRGDVGFPILFGGGFLSDTYPDVFRCILHVS